MAVLMGVPVRELWGAPHEEHGDRLDDAATVVGTPVAPPPIPVRAPATASRRAPPHASHRGSRRASPSPTPALAALPPSPRHPTPRDRMPVDPFPSDVKRPPRGLSRLTWVSSSAARLFGVRRRKSAGADASHASLDSAASRPPDLRRAMSLDDVSRHLSARSSRGTRLEVAITVPEGARGGEELLLETEFGELVVPLPWHARPGQRLVVEVPDLAGGASVNHESTNNISGA